MQNIPVLINVNVCSAFFDRVANGDLFPWELWLLGALAFLIFEFLTLGLYTIWFSGGCVAASFVSMIPAPFVVQVIVCLAVSILLLSFLRPFAVRKFNLTREKTNVSAMVGKEGIVLDGINNVRKRGTVTVDGMEWSAKSDDGQIIAEGAQISVLGIEGVTLIVKEV